MSILRRRPMLRRFVFACLALLISLVVLEVLTRLGLTVYLKVFKIDLWKNEPTAQLQIDENTGWVPKPEYRFRGRVEVPEQKPAGVFRIISMGDSCTNGAGVEGYQAWSAQLEQLLDERGLPYRVEVLNAGVNGFALAQIARYFETTLMQYEPDMLIVYANALDSSDFPVPLGSEMAQIEFLRPKSHASRLQIVTAIQKAMFRWKSYYLLKKLVVNLRSKSATEHRAGIRLEDSRSGYLMMLRMLCDSIGAKLTIVEYVSRNRNDESFSYYVPSWNETRQWEGTFVPIRSALLESGRLPEDIFFDEVHPTVFGHSLIAKQIEKKILEQKLLPDSI